jgi:hypothetical protein
LDRKLDLLNDLLDGIKAIEEFREPPEELAAPFAAWVIDVARALEAAGMIEQLRVWNDGLD